MNMKATKMLRLVSSVSCKRWLNPQVYLQTHKNISSSSSSSSDDDTTEKYDVIIAGGGIVGSAMACAFAQSTRLQHYQVLLLEAAAPSIIRQLSPEYSNRVSTINPSSVALLDKLGVWEEIKATRVGPVEKMHVWEACSDAFIGYENERMQDEVAFVIENDVIVSTLAKQLERYSNRIEVLNKARAKSYKLPAKSDRDPTPLVEVQLENGTKLKTKLLIGADGPGSLVRKTMNVKYLQWSYEQNAIVATLQVSVPCKNTVAWQRFLPTGPIALLPLSKNLSSLVWSNTVDNCKHLLSLPDDEFVDALNEALCSEKHHMSWTEDILRNTAQFLIDIGNSFSVRQLPPYIESVKSNSRAAFPLGLGHSSNYVGERVVLIGDAAHRVHPLAGLGVNLGLGDVADLIKTLEAACYDGFDVAYGTYLNEYETRRQRHVVPTMAAIDGLHRLYTTTMPLVVLLRSVGLQITDVCAPLKQRIMSHASG